MSPRIHTTFVLVALAVCGAACNNSSAPAAGTAPSASAEPQAPGLSSATIAPAAAANDSVTGKVAETMDAATYTYLRLTTDKGDQWAAVPQTKVAVGDTVTIVSPTLMQNFESPTLHRKFDTILFGTIGAPGGPKNPHAGVDMAQAMPSAAPSAALVVSAVPKATGPGAHTVAEIVTDKATLKDKPVTVRGTVTKYNAGILGKNWLHVDDATRKGPGDTFIVVTTNDTAKVGDVVVVKGVVHTDKDFGAGYAYAVMIEDATLTK
jgi:hypothetical protein